VEDRSGEYVGLIRIWRNPAGPRLGLVGVRRDHRGSPLAPALLERALTAAETWGHPTFETETSSSNRVVYPRMQRVGAESLGRFFQMVRRP
jgi:GNAT superfamily N-acetyltransferase